MEDLGLFKSTKRHFYFNSQEFTPNEIDLTQAIKLVDDKQKADAPIYIHDKLPVTKGVGRFGPYLNGMDFINVSKKYDFNNLSDDNIVFLIEKIQKEKEKVVQIGLM